MPHCASLSITVTRVMLRTCPDLQPTVDFLLPASCRIVLPIDAASGTKRGRLGERFKEILGPDRKCLGQLHDIFQRHAGSTVSQFSKVNR